MTGTPAPMSPAPHLLLAGARRLTALAGEVRHLAAGLILAAADTGWESSAATACRDRLAGLAHGLLGAAALLEHAAAVVEDHARAAGHRAAVLEQAAREAAGAAGWLGVLVRVAA